MSEFNNGHQLHEGSAPSFVMRFLMVFVVSVAMIGCGDDSKLSRSKAENMIQNTARFKTRVVPTGTLGKRELPRLAQQDLVTYTDATSVPQRAIGVTNYVINLTEKGKQFVINEVKPTFGHDTITVVKVCERKIVEVTGIEQAEPQTATVSFTYSTVNPTPFGKTMPEVCSTEIRSGRAEMKLFDDGWRVGEISFSEGYMFDDTYRLD